MTPSQAAAWGRRHAWALLAALLALGALAGQFASVLLGEVAVREALGWVPERTLAEPWRAWTAAWVHLGGAHLGGNLLACAAVAAFGQFGAWAIRGGPGTGGSEGSGGASGAARPARDPITVAWTLAWLAAWPLTHVLLGAVPRVTGYVGLSGVLHAGVAVACTGLLLQGRGRTRALGVAVTAGLLAKLGLEQAWHAPVQVGPGGGIAVVVAAHATGAAAGALCGAACALALQRRRGR